jgi:hypothetical protein
LTRRSVQPGLWWLAALAAVASPLSFPSDVLAAIAAGFWVAGLRTFC